ncbi:hypothetical protein LMH73_014715 [Vibrio splendidus]|nr:hypothetical protein [Vibrio splendidus]MCC4882926.1 hypothetical protein [Vibrio splendidus]
MINLDMARVNELAMSALTVVKKLHGTYICKCLYVNGVFSLMLENEGVPTSLVSGKMVGGFNLGEKDSFRYGYAESGVPDLIDHHVWCVGDNGVIYDAMMLVMDEEMRLTSPSSGEFLLPKTALVNEDTLRTYSEIMDDCEIGLFYSQDAACHAETIRLLDAFLKHNEQVILSHL